MSKSALYYKILKALRNRIISTPSGNYVITNVALFPCESAKDDSMCLNNRHVQLMLHVKNKRSVPKVLSPRDYEYREIETYLQDYLDGNIEKQKD